MRQDHLDYQDLLVKDKDQQELLDHWETPDPLVTKVTEVDQVRSRDLLVTQVGCTCNPGETGPPGLPGLVSQGQR